MFALAIFLWCYTCLHTQALKTTAEEDVKALQAELAQLKAKAVSHAADAQNSAALTLQLQSAQVYE